jgi:hypothetical protein
MTASTASNPAPVRFTDDQRQQLKDLAAELNRKLGSAYEIDYDETDTGQEWAMFMDRGDGILQVLAGAGEDGHGHVLVDAEGGLVSTKDGTVDYAALIPEARQFLTAHWSAVQAEEADDAQAPKDQG